MAIVLDLIILAVFAVSVFTAYKKGLIKTAFSLVGGVVAVVLAINLSAPVGNWINEKFIYPAVQNTVLTAVNGSELGQSYDEAMETIDVVDKLQEMPEGLRTFLETLNVDVEEIVASANKTQEDTLAAKEKLIDSIVRPVSSTVSTAIALIGLIIVLFVLIFIASRLLDAIFRLLPFADGVNKTGGMIFGVLRGLLFVLILSAVIYGLAQGNVLLSTDELENTYLIRLVNDYNPILKVLK